jgi:hypothetical protein
MSKNFIIILYKVLRAVILYVMSRKYVTNKLHLLRQLRLDRHNANIMIFYEIIKKEIEKHYDLHVLIKKNKIK